MKSYQNIYDNFAHLLLEGKDMGNTTVDRISHPGLGFIGNCDHSLTPIRHRHMKQQFGNITSTKHLMDRRKLGRALLRGEVGCENAVGGALPAEELACTTW